MVSFGILMAVTIEQHDASELYEPSPRFYKRLLRVYCPSQQDYGIRSHFILLSTTRNRMRCRLLSSTCNVDGIYRGKLKRTRQFHFIVYTSENVNRFIYNTVR